MKYCYVVKVRREEIFFNVGVKKRNHKIGKTKKREGKTEAAERKKDDQENR